jgi:uncharacterized repeat protein (TIGR03803 family)
MGSTKYFSPLFRNILCLSFIIAGASLANPAFCQTDTVIHSFRGTPDGAQPSSSLVADFAKTLFGTTAIGGCVTEDCGVLFRFRPPDQFTKKWIGTAIHTFNRGDNPAGDLLFTGEEIFGVTETGGTGRGQIYQTFSKGSDFHIIHTFNGSDGTQPNGGLQLVSTGSSVALIGTTLSGGSHGSGVVFALLLTGGNWSPTTKTLHAFTPDGHDGLQPSGGLVFGPGGLDGYGTTDGGGEHNQGTIYKLTLPSSGGSTYKALYSFTGFQDSDGPAGAMVIGTDGSLYGITQFGGDPVCRCGTVFKLSPPVVGDTWTFTSLYGFKGGSDGSTPQSTLVFDSTGALYGTTTNGGSLTCGRFAGCGVVFKLTPPSTESGDWTESVYYAFQGTDGSEPIGAPLIIDGVIYGTTKVGGAFNAGTLFELNP